VPLEHHHSLKNSGDKFERQKGGGGGEGVSILPLIRKTWADLSAVVDIEEGAELKL